MSTTTEPTPAAPAIREDVANSITPVEIEEAMKRLLVKAKQMVPGITVIGIEAKQYAGDKKPHTDWDGHGINNACVVSCPSSESAIRGLAERLADPATIAEKKRKEAAALLAEADALDPKPRPHVAPSPITGVPVA
ncbi:hypothetical protein OPIT5_04035 [Opitutaceae bacterium TAV5]|nr:hypothetical protein OPIT5_04035 [Opitutaceae bacterium TAV5]